MVGRTFDPRQSVVSSTSLRSGSLCKFYALAGVALLGLNGCNGPQTPPPVSPVPTQAGTSQTGSKIGLLLPLSGRNARLGQQMANAAHIAIPEGHGVTLDIRDTDSAGGSAETAARAALDQGDNVILGPLTAAQTSAVAALTQPVSVPEFAYTSDQTQARSGLWVMGITVTQQVNRLVDAAVTDGRKSFAAFLPDTPFGHALGDALGDACRVRGLGAPQIGYHTETSASITDGLKTLASLDDRQAKMGALQGTAGAVSPPAEDEAVNPLETPPAAPTPASTAAQPDSPPAFPPPSFDALLLGDTGVQLATVIGGLGQARIDPHQTRLLGPALWGAFASKLGALQGGWFAGPDPTFRTDFVQRYKSRYGYVPSILANVAYDTATMAAVLSQQPDGFFRSSLLRHEGFAGSDGTFALQADGTVLRGLAVFEILPGGGVKMRSAAPRRLTR